MSKTIDEKVVEMSFDNRNFEKNVKETMTTLDKLKAKLNFSGMSKGLEEVEKASKNVDFSAMANSIGAIEKRFSTTGIVGMTTIQELTKAVIGFSKKAYKFSLGAITEGGKTRATKIENAKFQLKGLLKDFEDADKKLNDIMDDVSYGVDATAYGLDAAATVASQLVASGVEAGEGMRHALRGISGVAAMTNSTYEDIGRIYTTVAGNGRLMGDQLMQLSSRGMNAASVLAKALGKTEAEIREMVSKGKIDFNTFSKAMDDAFGEHAKDANKTLSGVLSNIRAALAKIGAEFYSPIIEENSPLIQLLNSVRERINDIRKEITPVIRTITAKINNMLTILNKWFNDTKNIIGFDPFEKFRDTLKAMQAPLMKVDGAFKSVTKTIQDYENVVNEIINGAWGNGQARWNALSEAGYDWAHAQNLVNEKLGYSLRRETSYVSTVEEITETTDELNDSTKDWIINLATAYKKESELKELNKDELVYLEEYNQLSKEQQTAIQEIVKLSKKLGMPIDELIKGMDSINGRWLIIQSFVNIGKTLIEVLKMIGKAWIDVFPPQNAIGSIFNITTAFYRFTRVIKDWLGVMDDNDGVISNAEHLAMIFRGLFSIIGLITDVIKGALSIVLRSLAAIMGAIVEPGTTLLDLLDLISYHIYNHVTKWRAAVKEYLNFDTVVELIGKTLTFIIKKFKEFNERTSFSKKVLTGLKNIIETLKNSIINLMNSITNSDGKINQILTNLFGGFNEWVEGLKNVDNIPLYIIKGLINGLTKYSTKLYNTIIKIGTNLIASFKKVLKIASPSKVFFSIGLFIMAGLVAGIKAGIVPLNNVNTEVLTNILNVALSIKDGIVKAFLGIANILKNIDYSKLLAVALGGGLMYLSKMLIDTTNRVMDSVDRITAPLKSFANLMDGLKASIGGYLKDLGTAKRMEAIKDVIKGIAVSILMIAASMYIISKIDKDRLLNSAAICGIMVVVLTALYLLIDKLATGGGTVKGAVDAKAKKATFNIGPIIAMSIALLAMSAALKKLSGIDSYSIQTAIKNMIIVIGMMTLLFGAIGGLSVLMKTNAEQLSGSVKAIKKLATSMLLMLLVIKLASKINNDEINKAIYSIGLISGIFAAFIILSRYAGKNSDKAAWLIASLSLSLLGLIGAIKILSLFKPKEIAKGVAAISGIVGAMGLLMLFSKKAGKNADKAALLIGSFSLSILGIIVAIKILSKIPTDGLAKASIALIAIGVVLGGLIALSHFAGKNAVKAGTMILFIAGALALLTGVIFILSTMSVKSLAKGTAVIAVIGLMFMGLIKSTEKSKNATKLITKLLVAMSVLLGFVIALSLIDNASLLSAAAVVTSIMGALSLLITSTKKMSKKDIGSLLAISVVLLATLGVLTLIIRELAKLDPESVLISAGSLSMLLVTLSGVMVAMTLVSKYGSKNALAGVALLTILSATVLPIITLIIMKLSKVNPDKTIKTVNSLSKMLFSMTIVLGALSLIGKLGIKSALVGIAGLVALLAVFGGILTGFGAITKKLPKAAEFLESGIPILTAIGKGIGEFVGSIIEGFGSKILNLLPILGTSLSDFMKNLEGFLDGATKIPKGILGKITALSASIIALTAAELFTAIGSLLSGRISLAIFGSELSLFMENLDGFLEGASKIKPEVAKAMKNLSEAIINISKASGYISDPLFGESMFEKFSNNLSSLGEGLSKFDKSTKNIKNVERVKVAADAIKIITEAISTIPNSGGFIGLIMGNNDADVFAANMPIIAHGIVGFTDVLNQVGFDENGLNLVKLGASAIKKLATVAQEIPNAGGLLAKLIGDNKLSTFAGQFPNVAIGISGFLRVFKNNGITDADLGLIDVGCSAITKFSTVGKEIPNTGGFLAWLVGDNDFSTFGESLTDLAVGLTGFITTLYEGKVTDDKMNLALSITDSISNLVFNLKKITIGKSFSVGSYFESISSGITTLISSISKVDSKSIKNALNKISDIIDFVNNFKDLDLEPLTNLASSLETLAKNGIENLVKTFENQNHRDKLKEASKALGESVIEGFKSKVKSSKTEKIGENFVKGFANGISNNESIAIKAASALGSNSYKALKNATKEKSPSKLTYEVGKFFDLGFVNGIKDYTSNVYSASKDIGDMAKIGISNAVSKITDIISSESDSQPTISPVLDLSNIESGANQINSIFANTNVGIGANINAISNGVRVRNQNATTNGDVVNAIDKLKNTITEQTPGNTYNLNGITYNDDTPIANAVASLINAIEIEGRV